MKTFCARGDRGMQHELLYESAIVVQKKIIKVHQRTVSVVKISKALPCDEKLPFKIDISTIIGAQMLKVNTTHCTCGVFVP